MIMSKAQLTEALVGAGIVGGLGFLAVWTQIDDVRVMITAGFVPALTHLGIALGIKGVHARNGSHHDDDAVL